VKIQSLFVPLVVMGAVSLGAAAIAAPQTTQKPPAQSGAQQPAQKPQPPAPAAAAAPQTAGRTHTVDVELVSVDQKAHTIAYKDAAGKTVAAPLQARAEKEAAALRAGDRVRLTCQDNAKGEHQAITAVQRVPASPRS
jgi:hypothetical protein